MAQVPAFYRDSSGRLVRQRASTGATLLLDVSGSMAESDGAGDVRRIDVLATVLGDVLCRVQLQSCFTFGHMGVTEMPLSGDINLPAPAGGTPLADAMQTALQQDTAPRRIVVLSDGEPNDRDSCYALADRCREAGIVIDAYYCGNPRDRSCREFMDNLAGRGAAGGRSGNFKLTGPAAQSVADSLVLLIGHAGK